MKEIPTFQDNTTLAEYLKEPLSELLLNHFYLPARLDTTNFEPRSFLCKKAEKILFGVYSDFNYLVAHVDNPGAVGFYFENDDSKLQLMAMMVDYYDMKVLSEMCEEYDCEMIDSEYMEHKLEMVQERFKIIKGQNDSKEKMKELIQYKQSISWLYFRGIELTTYTMILKETELLISNLKELDNQDCLESNPVEFKKTNKTPSFRLASKRKTDFIKILSSMYDSKIFVDKTEKPLTNKQKMMDAFGEFLGDDFSTYSASLSQAKTRDEKTFLKPFREIEKEALRYFNAQSES